MTKKFALAAMAAALLSTTVLAQSNPPAGSAAPAAKPMAPAAIQSTAAGKWRASKLVGLNVYNANNEKIGDINELITDCFRQDRHRGDRRRRLPRHGRAQCRHPVQHR